MALYVITLLAGIRLEVKGLGRSAVKNLTFCTHMRLKGQNFCKSLVSIKKVSFIKSKKKRKSTF